MIGDPGMRARRAEALMEDKHLFLLLAGVLLGLPRVANSNTISRLTNLVTLLV